MASKALSILKGNVVKSSSEFKKELEDRFSIINVNDDGFYMYVEEEEVRISGEIKTIRRVFVQSSSSDYGGVGWVINEDITSCMICHAAFGMFRWAHHCRSCGNLVCSQCSPDEVIIEELKELGPVRICIMCYWGQDPVHVTFQRQEKPLPRTSQLTLRRQQSMAFVPVFAVECGRFLQDNSKRKIVIHICLHDVMLSWPDDRDFAVCEDFFETRQFSGHSHEEEMVVEMYHVVVRPDILNTTDVDLEAFRTRQIAESVLAAVAEQFDHRLYRPMMLSDDRGYVGASDRVHLPWHRLEQIPKQKISRQTGAANRFFIDEATIPPTDAIRRSEPIIPEFRPVYQASDSADSDEDVEVIEQRRLQTPPAEPPTTIRVDTTPTAVVHSSTSSPMSSASVENYQRMHQLREFEAVVLATPEEPEQKRLMRGKLLEIISEYQPDQAQKVIDELLKLDVDKLLQLMQRKQALKILVYDTLIELNKDADVALADSKPPSTRTVKKVNSILSRRSISADEGESFMQEVALAAEHGQRLQEIRARDAAKAAENNQAVAQRGAKEKRPSATRKSRVVKKPTVAEEELDFGDIYGAEPSAVEDLYPAEEVGGQAADYHHGGQDDEEKSVYDEDEGEEEPEQEEVPEEPVEEALGMDDFGYEHAFEEKKHRTSILLQDSVYQQQTRESLQAFRIEKERESFRDRESFQNLQHMPFSNVGSAKRESIAETVVEASPSPEAAPSEATATSQQVIPPVEVAVSKPQISADEDRSATTVHVQTKAESAVAAPAATVAPAAVVTTAAEPSIDAVEAALQVAAESFRSDFVAVAGKGLENEAAMIVDATDRYAVQFARSINEQLQWKPTSTVIPALKVHVVPWIVIKTKDDSGKVFINLCHHIAVPFLPSLPLDVANSAVFQQYQQRHFVVFTLNKVRQVMFIRNELVTMENGEEAGAAPRTIDVVVNSQVFVAVNRDAELADKLFVKVLKAASRQHNIELDVDYKLPRTVRNYKGKVDDAVMSLPREVADAQCSTTAVSEASSKTPAVNSGESSRKSVSTKQPQPTEAPVKAPVVSPTPSQSAVNKSVSNPTPALLTPSESQALTTKWKRVLRGNAKVLFTSTIVKRNRLNIGVKRQLILTDEPALFYVDAATMTVKGDIEWSASNPPRAVKISPDVFDIITEGRTYRMEDQDRTADKWVTAITYATTQKSASRR